MNSKRKMVMDAAVRSRRVVQLMADGTHDIDPGDLCGGCATGSYILWKVLKGLGVEADLISGEYNPTGSYHAWVEVKVGRYRDIVDVTATQFGLPGPVYVTFAGDPDYGPDNSYNPPRKIRNSGAIRLFKYSWDQQSPFYEGDRRPDRAAARITSALLSKYEVEE